MGLVDDVFGSCAGRDLAYLLVGDMATGECLGIELAEDGVIVLIDVLADDRRLTTVAVIVGESFEFGFAFAVDSHREIDCGCGSRHYCSPFMWHFAATIQEPVNRLLDLLALMDVQFAG